MQLTITTIDTILFRGDAKSVTVPTAAGEVTILPKHMPIVSLVTAGIITVKSDKGTETFEARKGFLEVGKTETTILL
jgi:F-type H+-transporting ATPase subunit epsilon